MKDEVIKELYKHHKPNEEEKRIYYDTGDFVFAGFHAGCRVTEPLAKIAVLEEVFEGVFIQQRISNGGLTIYSDFEKGEQAEKIRVVEIIKIKIAELKEAMK